MSSVTPEQLLAADVARDRPSPAQPVRFWLTVVATPVVAAAFMVWFVLGDGEPDLSAVAPGTWFAIAVATAMVLAGELTPIIGARFRDPLGVAWSTSFAFAAVLFTDVLVAVALYAGASVVSGLVGRKAAYRWLFNGGQYALSIVAAWGVLALFGIHPSITEPWAPRGPLDVVACLLAAAAFFVVNEVLVSTVLGALDGRPWVDEFTDTLRFELAVNGSQLLIGPLVAVVMLHSPLLTVLAIVPVAAVHRSAASSHDNAWAADHDHLTGLSNRAHFTAVTQTAVQQVRGAARDTGLAVLLLDLDRFKEVNDVLGHPIGDRALCEVADRLRAAVPEALMVARLGGDEFAVTVPGVHRPEQALAIAARVGEALGQPFHESGHLIDLDASIGIALSPAHGTDVETLFSRADIAMYQAKRDASGATVFSELHGAGSVTRLGIIGSLRLAIERGELLLHYQPKVDTGTRALVGVEALVRWQHPSGEMVPPDDFIPVAEQSGLMPRLTATVIDLALSQSAGWRARGLAVPVAVNISLRDLLQGGFADGVAAALLSHGIPPADLTLEVTERVLAGDLATVRSAMLELHDLGVRLSMDDFGTGWASLEMLRQLPFTEVKLDRSFVTRAQDSAADLAVVTMVTQLAHALGLTTVAEGVETADVLDHLTALGCDQAQGWHVARPMPADDLLSWAVRAGATEPRTPVSLTPRPRAQGSPARS